MSGVSGRQMVLDLPHRTARGREDFLVTQSNRAAVGIIDRYPDWPHHAMAVTGPVGSGKTHLLEVWRQVSGATLAAMDEVSEAAVPRLMSGGALAIDDAPGTHLDERGLFHLLNYARQSGGRVLIASSLAPVAWPVQLPDLVSRLKAVPVAELGQPDDDLLRGVLVKLFADRQLAVDAAAIAYLVVRMPRSLDAARALVAAIDRRALEEKAEITRSFVGRVLQDFAAPGLFESGED